MSGTLRENICFGQPYDKGRFEEACRQAALHTDLQQLPAREGTLVGERGVTLSGG